MSEEWKNLKKGQNFKKKQKMHTYKYQVIQKGGATLKINNSSMNKDDVNRWERSQIFFYEKQNRMLE